MSRENVERIRRIYAAPDPLAALAERSAPDVEFDLTAVYPDQPVLRGIDEARRFRDTGPWAASQRFEPERFFDVDDERVLVFVRGTATGRESGIPVEARPAHEFTIRDGLLVRFKVYLDRAEALEAAGLQGEPVSADNVDVVRRLIESNRSDDLDAAVEALVALTDPRIEFTSVITAVTRETYRGHDGIRRYLRDMTDSWKEWRLEVEEAFEVSSDTVFATMLTRTIGRDSDAAVEARRGVVVELSEGKVLRARVYPSPDAALEAVGLRSAPPA